MYIQTPPHCENDRREEPRVTQVNFEIEHSSQCDFANHDAFASSGTGTPSGNTSSAFAPLGPPALVDASMAPIVYSDVLYCPDEVYSSWIPATLPHDPSIAMTPNDDTLFPSSCTPDVSSLEHYKREVGSQAQTQASLKRRKITPSDSPRPFSCPLCSKTFTRKKNLDDHKLRHENDKQFVCFVMYCLSRFNTKGDLARHVKIVHRLRLLW